MGFFDGIDEVKNGSFDTGGGNFEPIPDNTNLLVMADEAGWAEYEGDKYISVTWVVLAPSAYKNRKVFQKIRVYEKDAAKAKKARTMLAAIDVNCGGTLMALGTTPTDMDLMKGIMGKQIVIKVQTWEMNDKKGNWVCAVSPKAKVPEVEAAPARKREAPAAHYGGGFPDDQPVDDEIPF